MNLERQAAGIHTEERAIREATPAIRTLAKTMKAAVYRGRGDVRLETVPVPEIGEDEVLIRIEACGICGTDLKKIHSDLCPPPQIFGHEMAGRVARVGRRVARWQVGDRVMTFHHIPCEHCFYCEKKLYSQCPTYKQVGTTAGFEPNGGGFAQYIRVMPWVVQKGMVSVPSNVTMEEASMVEPVNTCLKGIRKVGIKPGETVYVIGQGPIGLMLMLLARREGARAMVSDRIDFRLEKARELGADVAVNPLRQEPMKILGRFTQDRGADVVLVAVHAENIVDHALQAARPGGRILLFAQNSAKEKLSIDPAEIGVQEKVLFGSYSASVDLQAEAAEVVFKRAIPVAELITHRFELEDIQQALELAARPAGNSLKVVIRP
ncbi:MAG TPA: zinc-dependent dehydrogenase [Candidatus Acidoferrales bacterium]